ncbi:MAG TPA: site-2 protease family protein [Pseudonocardiaceae bacterium]|jgi:Zn-dependent protease|nr:site-2 protease family protein [Pseudonocardiaceae bacterium]
MGTSSEIGGLLLFRLRGVPVLLAPSWWVGSIVITLLYAPLVGRFLPGTSGLASIGLAATFAILLGASVLLHELGHTLVAMKLNIPVRRLRLFLLGGLSEVARTPRRPSQEGWVAAAGPAVSAALALVFAAGILVVPDDGALRLLVIECAVANAAVAVFNLLPGLPLDGGRMLRAGVWAVTGKRRFGTRAAVVGGAAVAVGLIVWALSGLVAGTADEWLRLAVCVLTAWFVVVGASGELAAEQRHSWPEGMTLGEITRPVLQLPAESPVGDALYAAAGRGVVLVRADGMAVGLLDEATAQQLAGFSPMAPAQEAAQPIRPDTVLFDSESGEDIIDRVRETAAWQFLVVNDDGKPSGVLRREDLKAALAARRTG